MGKIPLLQSAYELRPVKMNISLVMQWIPRPHIYREFDI